VKSAGQHRHPQPAQRADQTRAADAGKTGERRRGKISDLLETVRPGAERRPGGRSANVEAIAKLLRFASTHTDSSAQTVSLEEYVSRMKEGQEKIYYITADSYAAAKSSPHLELLRKKGIEVLLLSDRIDEWMMSYLTEFDGKAFQSVAKADESLDKLADEVDESAKEAEKALEPFVERVKTLLGDRVKEVRLTHV
jgi:molecular chaperone HtpG